MQTVAASHGFFLDMKFVLIILGIVVLAGSILADYKWRKWMAERRRDRN